MTLLEQIGAPPLDRIPAWWEEHWGGMPAFVQERRRDMAIDVRFREDRDYSAFRRKIANYGNFSGKASKRVKPFMLFSNFEVYKRSRKVWVDDGSKIMPQYPIYIVSKGRADRQLTSRALQHMGVPHYVVIEEQERVKYERHDWPTSILVEGFVRSARSITRPCARPMSIAAAGMICIRP